MSEELIQQESYAPELEKPDKATPEADQHDLPIPHEEHFQGEEDLQGQVGDMELPDQLQHTASTTATATDVWIPAADDGLLPKRERQDEETGTNPLPADAQEPALSAPEYKRAKTEAVVTAALASTNNNNKSAVLEDDPPLVLPSTVGTNIFNDADVLSGRGGGTNVHPGNREFRDAINLHRRAYLKARKNDKPTISRSIVRAIRQNGGRFLKKDEASGLFFEIGDDAAREKTSQALRQRAPEMRKLLFDTEREEARAATEEHLRQQRILMGMPNDGSQLLSANAGVAATAATHHPMAFNPAFFPMAMPMPMNVGNLGPGGGGGPTGKSAQQGSGPAPMPQAPPQMHPGMNDPVAFQQMFAFMSNNPAAAMNMRGFAPPQMQQQHDQQQQQVFMNAALAGRNMSNVQAPNSPQENKNL